MLWFKNFFPLKVLVFLGRFFALVFTVLFLSLLGGLSYLFYKPIDLNFLTPYLEKTLSSEKNKIQVQAKRTDLVFNPERLRIYVRVKNFQVINTMQHKAAITIPEAQVEFSLKGLLLGRLVPSTLNIVYSHLKVVKHQDGHFGIDLSPVPEVTDDTPVLATFLNEWLLSTSSNNHLMYLKEVNLIHGTFEIEDQEKGKAWELSHAYVSLAREKEMIEIHGSIGMKEAKCQFQAQADVTHEGKTVTALTLKDVRGSIENLPLSDLPNIWLEGLAPKPRKWVLENLSDGSITKAGLKMSAHIDLSGETPQVTLPFIEGVIRFSDVTVRYMDGFPPAEHVKGEATFDKTAFHIALTEGNSQDLKIVQSKMTINHLDLGDQDMIIDVRVKGPISQGLQLIDVPSLQFAKKFHLNPKQIGGTAVADLRFAFPLETWITLDNVDLNVRADLQDVRMENVLPDAKTPVYLTKGALALEVDKKLMKVAGDVEINGTPARVTWHERFQDASDWKRRYHVQTTVDEAALKSFALEPYWTGSAALDLEYMVVDQVHSALVLNGDFQKADLQIPTLGSFKAAGQTCQAKVRALFSKGALSGVPEFKLKGEAIDITGHAAYTIEKGVSHLRSLEVPSLKAGKTDLQIHVARSEDGRLKGSVAGTLLDLRPYFTAWTARKGTGSFLTQPLEMDVDIKEIAFRETLSLFEISGWMLYQDKEWRNINIKSVLSKEAESKKHLTIDRHQKDGVDALVVFSNSAGDILRILGLHETIKGGSLKLSATKFEENPWEGKVKLKDFTVQEAPVLAQLLTLASPFGIFEMAAAKGIAFTHLRTNFRHSPEVTTLTDGRASGMSLGLTFSGSIDRAQDKVNIRGSVIPAYVFNSILNRIPLIGELFGGKGGGVLGVSYAMSGGVKDPKISVNPLSALTPGFLRKIFEVDNSDEAASTPITNEAEVF